MGLSEPSNERGHRVGHLTEPTRLEVVELMQPVIPEAGLTSLPPNAYYLLVGPSSRVVSAWEPYVKNFAPNLGNDYGGRLMSAWLDR